MLQVPESLYFLGEKDETRLRVIIDDYDDFLREQIPFFVQTNPDIGLTQEDAQKAITILNTKYEI